jgi:hypothetical protein
MLFYVIRPLRFESHRQIGEELAFITALCWTKTKVFTDRFWSSGHGRSLAGHTVNWGQICAASVILEATRENVRVELSQGSHYFHNIINLGVNTFLPFSSPHRIDWDWLQNNRGEFPALYTPRPA